MKETIFNDIYNQYQPDKELVSRLMERVKNEKPKAVPFKAVITVASAAAGLALCFAAWKLLPSGPNIEVVNPAVMTTTTTTYKSSIITNTDPILTLETPPGATTAPCYGPWDETTTTAYETTTATNSSWEETVPTTSHDIIILTDTTTVAVTETQTTSKAPETTTVTVTSPYETTTVTQAIITTTEITTLPPESESEVTSATTTTTGITSPPTSDGSQEGAIVPSWEEIPDSEKYTYLHYDDITYSLTLNECDISEITFLENSKFFGQDELTEEIKTADTVLFSLNGFPLKKYIVALTIDGHYRIFHNHKYSPDTLGEFLDDLSYLERNTFTEIRFGEFYDKERKEWYSLSYKSENLDNVVREIILSDRNAPVFGDIIRNLKFKIYCDNGRGIRVYENGYISFSEVSVYYYIGEDTVKELQEYIDKNETPERHYY